MPKNCEFIDYFEFANIELYPPRYGRIFCKNFFDHQTLNRLAGFSDGFLFTTDVMMAIKSKFQLEIVNSSYLIFNMPRLLPKLNRYINIRFLNNKGLDIESIIFLKHTPRVLFTNFNLYKNRTIVKDCVFSSFEIKTIFTRERGKIERKNRE